MARDPQQKRSGRIGLLIMGLAGVYAALPTCSGNPEASRNIYASRDECEQDYSPSQCASHGGSTGHFHGPYYWSDPYYRRNDSFDPGPGRTYSQTNKMPDNLVTVEKSKRQGFGRSSRHYGISS